MTGRHQNNKNLDIICPSFLIFNLKENKIFVVIIDVGYPRNKLIYYKEKTNYQI